MMFTSYQNYSTSSQGTVTTYAGGSFVVAEPASTGGGVGYNYVTTDSRVGIVDGEVTYQFTTSSRSDTSKVTYSSITYRQNETYIMQFFHAGDYAHRYLFSSGCSYFEDTNYDEPQITCETSSLGDTWVRYTGTQGTALGPLEVTTNGYTAAQGTTQSNYYKTTQKTSYYTTVPTLSDGTCSTVAVTLTGGGTTRNISDNFTTESDILSTILQSPDQYGAVNYYHVGRDDVLFTGVPAATNLNNYRFSDVYKLHPPTSYSYRETSNSGFAGVISQEFYEFINYFDMLAIRPVNLSSWEDSDQSQTGSFWAGFGNSFNATNQPVYKTLTTSSAGDTWAESNLLQTTDIGNAIDDAGPRIIQTGCQPWTQDGTTSWSTPASTVQSSTESTLMATYSSTVSTSTAEGQPTTSTRSDKYASYTIGLDSLAATSDTTTHNTIFPVGTSGDYSNPARADDFKLTLGRDNEYSSNHTLVFRTGVFITSTENNGGGDTVGTTTLTQTNGTFVSTQQIGPSFTTAETFSGWTRELAQGAALAVDGEAIYNYSVLSPIPAFPINTNLGL